MKNYSLYLLIAFASLVFACGGNSPTDSDDDSFSLRIVVTNNAGEPVSGLRVSAWNQLEFVPFSTAPTLPLGPVDQASLIGDINCNGIAFEQADLDDLKQFFVLGDSAFLGHVACSRANSDLNQDGQAPTLLDLVWLMRIVAGVGPPENALPDSVNGRFTTAGGWLGVADSLPIAALLITTVNRNTSIIIQNDSLEMISHFDPTDFVTRTLLTPKRADTNSIGSFTSLLLSRVTGGCCSAEIEAATIETEPVRFREFFISGVVGQLHPIPSSDKFSISFEFLRAGSYHMEFRDMEKNIVWAIDSTADVGLVSIEMTPPSPHNAFYRWDLIMDVEGSNPGFNDFFVLFWRPDPETNILGSTDRFGRFQTLDSLRFPNTFGYSIDNVDSSGNRIGFVRPLDATQIYLFDPRTGRSQEYQSSVGKGKNLINLTWDGPF